jgi:hypothetical protein
MQVCLVFQDYWQKDFEIFAFGLRQGLGECDRLSFNTIFDAH